MSIGIASYNFHSWARKGISSTITEKDDLGAGTSAVKERSEINLPVTLNNIRLTKNFKLIGPGDIIGVNRDMIVRTEPLNYITDFEPNYLAFVEFYDEDFAWRYTPAAPLGEAGKKGSKLRPWLFLLILKEDEFERTKRKVPVPSITIKNKDAFPPADETWLWAHVHSNADIPPEELSDYEKFLLSLNKTMSDDPDQLYCRLMSPRKLEVNTAYHAFIIPAFETGRLAGLEQPAENIAAQLPSWSSNGAKGEMPVYFEWYFRTGVNADFESLVKLLEPRKMDAKVGIRDMDCSQPGFVRADNTRKPFPGTSPAIIGLEGAIKSPDTVSTIFPDPVTAKDFQAELQKIVNLPITITGHDVSGDPIISIPFYGNKHAKKSHAEVIPFDIGKNTWVHDLNKDPRTRVAAGLGTTVIQKNQENYMRKAWEQVQKIIEANRKIRLTQFYMKVSSKYTQKTFTHFQDNVLVAISKPLLSRIIGTAKTVSTEIQESNLPGAVFTGAFRKMVRPGSKVFKTTGANTNFIYTDLVKKLNNAEVKAAPPKTSVGGTILVNPEVERIDLDSTPIKPGFRLKIRDEIVTRPHDTGGTVGGTVVMRGENDEAKNFGSALTDLTQRVSLKAPEKTVVPVNLTTLHDKVNAAIDPRNTFPSRLSALIKFPAYINIKDPEKILPVMAYPDFEDPMYKGLTAISDELLLPNLKLIPPNTISLLKTNQKFIESYLVGLNHEMGRELLWREYPTDERGSYFRQFWDVNGVIRPAENKTPAQLIEEHKDIDPIHTWRSDSLLGFHNKRDTRHHSGHTGNRPGHTGNHHGHTGNEPNSTKDTPSQLVLLIRGDLLKRFPNTVIFAQKAITGRIADDLEIDLDLNTPEKFEKNVKFPLYKAEIKPDIKFFGFDLTIEQAKGTDVTPGFTDKLGWFFIIQEVPGEPRFGMDIKFEASNSVVTWDDLAWDSFAENIQFIKKGVRPQINILPENGKDLWGVDSANMAYILFQKPAMVAVHSNDMLENLNA